MAKVEGKKFEITKWAALGAVLIVGIYVGSTFWPFIVAAGILWVVAR